MVHLGQLNHLEFAGQDDQTPISEATVIRPGDTVLIGTARRLSQAEANRLATQLGDRMPGVKVLVLEGVTAISAYRPEDPERPE
ncbi:hypothetical protein [Streptomyces sp. NPDC002547]